VSDQARHILVILIGAGVAVVGAVTKVCDTQLYLIATAVITGEFGLARSGSPSDRKLTVQHTTGPSDTTTFQGPPT
jgi:hypothetical protein